MKGFTLFLDRDGVINERLPGDYVRNWEEFRFLPGVLDALCLFASYFGRVVVVTNQQGIGKGLMQTGDLDNIHHRMLETVRQSGGRIDGVYFCPDLSGVPESCRKPSPAMALSAKRDFPEIDFGHSVMVGDSASDMAFGFNLGMRTVLIDGKEEDADLLRELGESPDYRCENLLAFARLLH